jgi:hypothetical protein
MIDEIVIEMRQGIKVRYLGMLIYSIISPRELTVLGALKRG